MAAASRGTYKRMYSWWWDSHISPKNSKLFQENLKDMDVKYKHMIKLLEDDGDSFAKKAEMYYKKRPELKKLVKEFYGAYCALAERYDHATGVLRQAHQTMAEAFPNQVPLDDSPSDSDPRTPEMNYLEESDSLLRRKGSKHFDELCGSGEGQTKFGEGRARKGLHFQDAVEKEQNNGSHDRVEKDDSEISSLKKVLAKLEAEKEASLVQYRESLERISKLELEVSNEQESSSKLNDRARKAEDEVKVLKESLEKLEIECKTSLLRYQQSLDKMSNLESEISRVEKDGVTLSERASKAETEVEDLKQELSRVEAEKEAALVRHQQCLEKISNLEIKLSRAEEDARKYNEKADKAESELITLREALKKLKEENEAEALKYQECMEKIASLELTINYSKEEAERLQLEIDNGIAKIKGAEEKCLSLERSNQTLQFELDSLMLKMGQQNQELTEKQQELGRLWSGMQEEHSRFVEAETAFQTLQHLHLKSEEELKLLGAEIQNRDQTLKNLESHNQSLDDQVQKVMGENMALNELKLSSALSIKNLQDEISRLKVTIGNIEAEVELRVNERNALQQEIYCLKEEINDLNKKNGAMIKQVEAVGYEPDCFESSVTELQAENKTLKANFEEERSEKEGLLQKLTVMKELLNKNVFLENSISDMNVEIEELREKVKLLEGSCQFLMEEKATLVAEKDILTSHLQTTTENLEKLTNKSMFLENSLSDANAELEEFRKKAKSLQDLCLLLDKEKSGLITERENVQTELENSISVMNVKIEELREKAKLLEGSCQFLMEEKATLVAEKDILTSHLQTTTENLEKLTNKSMFLENSLSDANAKLEEFRTKAKSLEDLCLLLNKEKSGLMTERENVQTELENSISDMNVEIEELREKEKLLEESCQFLMEENATLVTEKDILTSHLQTTTENLEKLKNKSMFLENSLSDANAELEEFRTKAKSLQDLCLLLDKEKSGLITERENVQTELETSQKLLKDAKERFAELEGTHSVLVGEKESSLRDLESLQSSLDSKKQEHANFAELSKTRLADLELQNRFLREEGQDWKNQFEEELNRAINSHMEIFILQKCLQDMEEKSLALQLERQELLEASIQSDKSISELERGNFEKDLLAKTSAETITMLRSGLQDMENSLLDLCDEKYRLTIENFVIEELLEQLRLEAGSIMAERNTLDQELRMQNEEFRKVSEMNEELRSKVAKGEIKEENLISEMENLSRKLHNLEEEHQNLQAENFKALDENCLLAKAVQHLKDDNFYMMSELTYQTQLSLIFREIISEKCEELKDLGDNLDKLRFMNGEHEENVRNLEGKLGGFQIENLEHEKSLEKSLKGLHEAEERQVLMEKEMTELHNMFNQLKAKNNEFMKIQEGQGKKMLKLSDDNDRLAKETLFLHEMKHNLEGEVQNLQEEIEQKKIKNETLSDELEKNKSEVQLWETQAAEFLSELQISVVREVLFSEKIHEFSEAFESLQEKCDSKERELEIHAERRSSLEEEIERLNIELGSYIPAIKSLNNSITSMEEHTIKSKVADKQEAKDSDLEKCDTSESCAEKYDDRISLLQSGSYELQGLLQRLLAIELAVIEAEKLSTKEKLSAKDEDALPRENGDISRPAIPQQIESGAGNEVSTKDIVLDENSECSSFGISRKETSEVDDHMLADYHLIKACKKPHSKHSSTESLVEKELGVDKLEISSRFSEPDPEVRKRKIIEGLEADAAKLTNLQTTVQDLKRKMEGKAKNRKGKVSEYDSLKGKLEEAEEAITRLFYMNRKLTKNVQDHTLSGDQNSFSGPDELGRIRSRRISEQARKGSEKIGRLQLEMDKLQFILLKLEDEIQMRDRARAVDRKQRVLLRDYLYGRTKVRPKSKRGMFCACLNPPTGED